MEAWWRNEASDGLVRGGEGRGGETEGNREGVNEGEGMMEWYRLVE